MRSIVPAKEGIAGLPLQLANRFTMPSSFWKSRSDLFRAYGQHADRLKNMNEEIECLAKALVLENMGASANIFAPAVPGVACAELALRPTGEIRAALAAGVAGAARQLAQAFVNVMDNLVEQKQVGVIQWFSRDVCRFSYYTATHKDEVLRAYASGGRFVTEKQRTHYHLRHVHDAIDARVIPLPAKDVQIPQRVQNIIKCIPDWLVGFARVVVGTEIAGTVTEVDSKTEIIIETYTYDPALIVAHYVLAGWTAGQR